MANEQNLKPQNKRTKSEQREIAKKGGKASGEARRERQQLKEELMSLLSDGDTQEKICLALVKQALRGNIKAFEIIRDTIGEKPAESIEITKSISETVAEIEVYIAKRRELNELKEA